jgi:DNA repair/transcription protein MET18/MMS19
MADLAKTKPQLILDIAFPAFLAELPDSEVSEKRDASIRQRKSYKAVLAALAQFSSERAIFEVLLRRLFSKLEVVLSSNFVQFVAYSSHYFLDQLSSCYHCNHLPCHPEKITFP